MDGAIRSRRTHEKTLRRISKMTGQILMTEKEKQILEIASETPDGYYETGAFTLFIDTSVNSVRVTITSLTNGNYQILFEESGVTYGIAHLSWWNLDSPARQRKVADLIFNKLVRVHKNLNHKPLIQRLFEWIKYRKNKK